MLGSKFLDNRFSDWHCKKIYKYDIWQKLTKQNYFNFIVTLSCLGYQSCLPSHSTTFL